MLLPETILAMTDATLNELGATRSTIAGLSELGVGTVSDLLNGVRPPTNDQAQLIYKWLSGLRKYVEAVRPIPVNFKEIAVLREHITLLEGGRLQVSVVIQEPRGEKVEIFAIRFKSGTYFLRARQNYADQLEILSSMNIQSGANFLGRELAEQALKSLETLGRTGCQVVENKYAIEDNAFFDLESVGLATVERL